VRERAEAEVAATEGIGQERSHSADDDNLVIRIVGLAALIDQKFRQGQSHGHDKLLSVAFRGVSTRHGAGEPGARRSPATASS
jgi:hypothetical protein